MQDIVDFETKLANITIPSDMRRDEEKLYNLMKLGDLQIRAPFVSSSCVHSQLNHSYDISLQIDWRKFFEDAMRIVNRKVTNKEEVVVYAPEYLGNLTTLIKEYNKTTEGKM